MSRHVRILWAAFGILGLLACSPPKPEIAQLEPELQAVLDKVKSDPAFNDADVALVVRGAKVAEILNSINSIPAANRQVAVQVVRENRKLKNEADYYLELYDLPDNRASGEIQQVAANWTGDGKLAIDATLAVSGTAKIHGHYNPVKTGGRVGVNMSASTTLRGRLAFDADPKELLAVTFELDPAVISYHLGSSIKDQKDFCWSFNYPCGGTWREPIRSCEARDCKRLWQYEIPIGIRDNVEISGNMVRLPVQVGVPREFTVNAKVGDKVFQKKLAIDITPSGFTSDSRGLFMKAKVSVKPTAG